MGELAGKVLSSSVGASGSSLDLALLARRYSYLTNQPLLSLTWEKVTALKAELAAKEAELAELNATSPGERKSCFMSAVIIDGACWFVAHYLLF